MTTLPAFTKEEFERAKELLGIKVAYMMGRKFEEGDWASVYCAAKQIPESGWSNTSIDVNYEGLGVEHKMLCKSSDKPLTDHCGTTLMHPAATRSIRIPQEQDPEIAKDIILREYGALIESRSKTVASDNADMRFGWLLWQTSLRQFIYFEERMEAPDPSKYWAEWNVKVAAKSRKASRSLWIYERNEDGTKGNRKRYSITTDAGAKVQPYFDVPASTDANIYIFDVIGEVIDGKQVIMWLTSSTFEKLQTKIGDISNIDDVSKRIEDAIESIDVSLIKNVVSEGGGSFITVNLSTYEKIRNIIPEGSDEGLIQIIVDYIQ